MKPIESEPEIESLPVVHLHDTQEESNREIPDVESPYAGQILTFLQHFKISSFWFASNFVWGALLIVMLPSEVRILALKSDLDRAKLLGVITGVAALVALFVPLVVGALSDRCSSKWGRRRPYIATGTLVNLMGLATMAIGFQRNSVPVFFLAYVLVQLGNNIASAAYSGIIPDLIPANQRGAASGYMAVMSQVGTLIGGFLCGVLLKDAGEEVKYAAIGVVMAGVACITMFGIKENPLPVAPPALQWKPYLKSLWIDPRIYPDFAWVWITRALVMVGFYAILPFIQYYLSDVIRVANPSETSPKLLSLILVGATLSGYFGGFISDKIGRKRVVYLANVVIAVMTVALIFCTTLSQTLLVGVLFGLGYGAYISVDWALGTDVLPSEKDAAKDMAVWHISMTLPQSIGAPVAGFILASFGQSISFVAGEKITHYNMGGYAAVFTLSAVCFLLGALLLRNVKRVK